MKAPANLSINKKTQDEINQLASFPELNPNPLVEIDLSGKVCYLNPSAKKLFPDLELLRNKHIFLAELNPLIRKIKKIKDGRLVREIKVNNHWYQQTFHYLNDSKRVRIYSFDISERKEIEEKLKESESRLNKAQEIAQLGSWELDLINNKLTWSDETYRIFGLKPQEFEATYEAFLKAVHPDDRKAVDDAYFNSLKEGKNCYEIEHRVVRRSTGEIRIVREKCEHIYDKSGKVIRSIGMVQDITERKHAEKALHKSEKRYKILFEKMTEGFALCEMIWDKKGNPIDFRYLSVNPAWENHTGLSRDKVINRTYKEIISKTDKFWIEKYGEIMCTGKAAHLENRVESMSKWFDVFAYKYSSTQFAAIFTDVTERKLTEETLRESEEKFRAVAETAQDAIISADSSGEIIYFNQGAEHIFGYSACEALGKPLTILMPERFQAEHQDGFFRFLSTGRPHVMGKTVEMAGKKKDGKEFPIELSLANWQAKEKTFFTAIIRDITERKNLDQRKDEFITIAGHELRTPISAIKIMNQMLQDILADNPQALKYLKKIEQQSDTQTNLINDLLDVSKIQTGKLEIRKEQLDLRDLIEEAAENMQQISKTHKFITKCNIRGKIFADRERIMQVLVNFCSNAVKFSPKGGEIIIDLKAKQNEAVVSVTDHGIGIPKENHSRMFEKFYRVYGSGNKSYPGLGMGLYISYQIIKLHNGNVWFKSEPGKGSTFYFSLPFQT